MIQHHIVTPELVRFRYQVAGLATRMSAWVLDQVIAWLVYSLTACSVAGSLGWRSPELTSAVLILLFFLLQFAYFTAQEYLWSGRTLGKRWMGIRVISAHGGRLTFADVLLRNLLRPVDMLPNFVMLLGGVLAFLDPRGRRLGDFAADTLVVFQPTFTMPEAMIAARGRVNTYQQQPGIRNRVLSRVTREEQDLMLDLMARRDQLSTDAREALFARAASYFSRRYELPDDEDHLSDEQKVLNLALVVAANRITG